MPPRARSAPSAAAAAAAAAKAAGYSVMQAVSAAQEHYQLPMLGG